MSLSVCLAYPQHKPAPPPLPLTLILRMLCHSSPVRTMRWPASPCCRPRSAAYPFPSLRPTLYPCSSPGKVHPLSLDGVCCTEVLPLSHEIARNKQVQYKPLCLSVGAHLSSLHRGFNPSRRIGASDPAGQC